MKKIIVRLLWPATAASQEHGALCHYPCECSVTGTDAVRDAAGLPHSGTLADIIAALDNRFTAENTELYVLLPAEWVSYTRVSLPTRNQRQALQALPFMVEEQLANDIEDMHLAVGQRGADGQRPVFALPRESLRALLACFESSPLKPVGVFVDAGLLKVDDGQLHVLLQGQRALLHSADLVTAVDLDSAATFVDMLATQHQYRSVLLTLESGSSENPLAEKQRLVVEQCHAELSSLQDIHVAAATFESSLAALLIPQKVLAVNLLQGEFQVAVQRSGAEWKRLAAAVLLVAVTGQWLLQLGTGFYFSHVSQIARHAAEDSYRKLFPDARQVSEPRKRLEYKLRTAGAQNVDGDFAAVFGSSMSALQSVPNHSGLAVQQLRYARQRGELELEIRAQSIEQMDAFKQALGKAGLKADITSANENENGVLGRIQISSGAGA